MTPHDPLWQIWLAALITLGVYSYLYSDNRLYRILLNTLIGLNVGYTFIIIWKQTVGPLWWDQMIAGFGHLFQGEPGSAGSLWIIVGFLGVLWYFQLSRKYLWLSRIVIGMAVGAGAGVVFKSSFLTNAPQITDSFRPLVAGRPTPLWSNGTPVLGGLGSFNWWQLFNKIDWWQSFNNILFVGTIVCVMVYFFFSFSHEKKAVGGAAKAGRWLLMISFGAFFGNTVMTRMAVFLERLQYLIRDWAPRRMVIFDFSIPSVLYALGIAVLMALGIYLILSGRPAKPRAPKTIEEEPTAVPTGGEAR